jgi:hypothetical protein
MLDDDEFIDEEDEKEEKRISGDNIFYFQIGKQDNPDLPYYIDGSFKTSGFGYPLSKEEFNDENINRIIREKVKHESEWYKIPINKIKIKITEDCRIKQTTLFNF